MRVLFASTRGTGHFGPLVPVAAACVRRGHDVLVAGPEEIAGAAARAGFAFRAVADPPPDELGAVWGRVPSLSPDEQNAVVVGEIFGRLNTTAALPGMRDAIRDHGSDLVVHESAMFAGALAAQLEGIPHARVGVSLVATEEGVLRWAAGPVDAIRAEAGLPPDPEADTLRRSAYLTAFPPALEDPAAPSQPATHRFRDPAWDADPGAAADRWEPEDDTTPPLVYVTFGTQAGALDQARPVYRAALEAVADLPVRVLLTVGAAGADAVTGPVPRNVVVEPFVPQAEVLAHAAAVVHHGGAGTTLGTLAAELPAVVVPLFADQPANAARVEAVGAGVVAPPHPAALHAALGRVLDGDAYAAGAARIATELRAQPPADDVVAVLEALA